MAVRLLLIDEQPLVREGLRSRLEATGRFTVVGETDDLEEATRLTLTLAPELVVLDIGLCRKKGMELARSLLAIEPAPAVLILTMQDNEECIAEAIRAGVRGYVLKKSPTHQVISAIEAVATGGTYYSRVVVNVLNRGMSPPLLSRREREVLVHVVEGYSNKETARLLNLSVRTIETHRETIRRKLGAESTLDLVRQAVQMGLINF